MAGIDEQGATEGLNLLSEKQFLPEHDPAPSVARLKAVGGVRTVESADHLVMNQVVDILGFKASR